MDVCPADDLQTFHPSRGIERVRPSKLIQTNLTEPELNSLSLVRLMKRCTFGLGLTTLKSSFLALLNPASIMISEPPLIPAFS